MSSIADLTADQENVYQGKRGITNGPSSASKRPALSLITNKPEDKAIQRRFSEEIPRCIPSFTQDHYFPSSTVAAINPPSLPPSSTMPSLSNLFSASNTSLSNAIQCSFEDSAFSLSMSTISFCSPGLCSPMLVSTPVDPSPPELGLNSEVFGEYTEEIYANLKHKESLLSPPAGFIHLQPDITPNMRAILVDWLVEVAEEFQLHPDTLYLSIAYTDRYMSKVSIPRSKLQLVGTTSLYIAAKYEEIHPPDIGEFAYITDDTYTKRQIVKLEQDMLKVLDFQLVQPTVNTFISRYLEISKLHMPMTSHMGRLDYLVKYLGELSLLDVDPFSKYIPSFIAASAVCLARHILGMEAWPLSLQTHTGYRLAEISNCVQDLHRAHAMAPRHTQTAIRLKYMTTKYLQIAQLNSPETFPC